MAENEPMNSYGMENKAKGQDIYFNEEFFFYRNFLAMY